MDGTVSVGGRSLVVEFQCDRHSGERMCSAYRRIELTEKPEKPSRTSVQKPELVADNAAQILEVQG